MAEKVSYDMYSPQENGPPWLLNFRRRKKLLDTYLFALDACLRQGADKWWKRVAKEETFSNDPESAKTLKDFCLHHLLYEAGDVAAFCKAYEILDEEGLLEGDDQARFLLRLAQHVRSLLPKAGNVQTGVPAEKDAAANALARIEPKFHRRALGWLRRFGRRRRRRALVSVIIPNDMALSNFIEFCMPSLLAGKGFRSLAATHSMTVHVHALPSHRGELEHHLRAAQVDRAVIGAIPPDLSDLAKNAAEPERGWLVGALQGVHLEEAKRQGSDYISINPNAVYAAAFLDNVLRIVESGQSAVVLATFRTDPDKVRAGLTEFRTDKDKVRPKGWYRSLGPARPAVPSAADLVELGLRAVAEPNSPLLIHGFGEIRGETAHLQAMWEGEDFLHLQTTQYEVAYLAHEVLHSMPDRFFIKPSADIDRILPSGTLPHFVRKSDDIAMLDIGETDGTFGDHHKTLIEFGHLVGGTTRERQARFFSHGVYLPVSRTSGGKRDPQVQSDIERKRSVVLSAMYEACPSQSPPIAQSLAALHCLHLYEVSEYGRQNLSGVILEAKRILDLTEIDADKVAEADLTTFIRNSMNFDYFEMAMKLAKSGGGRTSFINDFLTMMMETRAVNDAHADQLRARFPEHSFAVIGSVVWGDKYIDRFMNYCVPSLLAAGNIPALSQKKKVVHSIVTTESDRDAIMQHPAFVPLKAVVEVVFTCFPASYLEERERSGYNFYAFYGLLDHQNVFFAASLKADLYLIPADCVYSGECLKNFSASLEDAADCCTIGSIEVDESQFRSWIKNKIGDLPTVMDLKSEDLLQAASERTDSYFRSLIMSPHNVRFCRHPRELAWPVADGLVLHSIFVHPLAVSARLLARPFHYHHENVDYALIPRLLQGSGRLVILRDARQAVLVHLGAPTAREDYIEGGFSLEKFVEVHNYSYAVHRECFEAAQFFACRNFFYGEAPGYAAELAVIQAALKRHRFEKSEAH